MQIPIKKPITFSINWANNFFQKKKQVNCNVSFLKFDFLWLYRQWIQLKPGKPHKFSHSDWLIEDIPSTMEIWRLFLCSIILSSNFFHIHFALICLLSITRVTLQLTIVSVISDPLAFYHLARNIGIISTYLSFGLSKGYYNH